MITMDAGVIGTVDKRSREVIAAETKMNKEEKEKMRIKNKKRRMKMRGREVAGKGKLISSSRKEDLKRSLIRYALYLLTPLKNQQHQEIEN